MEDHITYIRSFKIYGITIFDYVMSYVTLFVLLTIAGLQHLPRYYAVLIPFSVLVHILVGQETRLTKLVFDKEMNIGKIVFWTSLFIFSLKK